MRLLRRQSDGSQPCPWWCLRHDLENSFRATPASKAATAGRVLLHAGLSVLMLAVSRSAVAADDDLLTKVTEAWNKRLKAVERVRYRLSGTATYLPGSLMSAGSPDLPDKESAPKGFPPIESKFDVRVVWVLDLPGSHLRKETYEQSFYVATKAFRPFVRIDVFNGREQKGWYPREANTGAGFAPSPLDADVWIAQTDDISGFFNYADMPVLFAHGLCRLRSSRLRDANLAALPNLTVLGEVKTIDGRQVLLSTKKLHGSGDNTVEEEDRYWVDLERGAAVVRWENLAGSTLGFRVVTRWKKYDKVWFPEGWDCSTFEGMEPGKESLISMVRLNVDQLELDPPFASEDFEIPYKAGMIVQHESDNTRFRVAADGRTLEPAPLENAPTNSGNGAWASVRWIAVSLLVIGAALMYFYFRRR